MCVHLWARKIDERGHVIYVCMRPGCAHQVDWTAAREEYDRAPADQDPLKVRSSA